MALSKKEGAAVKYGRRKVCFLEGKSARELCVETSVRSGGRT
jgi:hypothetical protein